MIPSFSAAQAVLLVVSLSLDAFVASLAYGSEKIRIPPLSAFLLSGVSTLFFALSLTAGSILRPLLPETFAHGLCFLLLFLLAMVKLYDSSIKRLIRKQKISFSLFQIRFLLQVYADPERADYDHSHSLSAKEALSLAIALSLDSLAVGFGAAMSSCPVLLLLGLSFCAGLFAVGFGCFLGNRMAQRCSWDLSWLSGFLLLFLAFLRL